MKFDIEESMRRLQHLRECKTCRESVEKLVAQVKIRIEGSPEPMDDLDREEELRLH